MPIRMTRARARRDTGALSISLSRYLELIRPRDRG